MATQTTDYKCPACTGPLHFAVDSGRLECEYCDSSFSLEEIEALYAEKEAKAQEAFRREERNAEYREAEGEEWDMSRLSSDWGTDEGKMRVYSCSSCGAEIICDVTTAATSCPYCGNNAVVPGQFDGTLKPDYIIPFKLDKKAAEEALKRHYKGKRFLPKSFKSENHIKEIKGVYVPFWLFDGRAEGQAVYHATRSRVRRSGDTEITTTKHYRVLREGSLAFERVPVDGSSKMPDDHMDSIEPFDYKELKPFSTGYLPGFLADKYDVTAEESHQRADERCKNTLLESLRSTVTGYETCIQESQFVNLKRGKVHYALMPVWMLNTRWEGKDYLFAMNGQTGKLVGDLPISWGKFWLTFVTIAVPLAVIMGIIEFLF